jgi:hypothetical protein
MILLNFDNFFILANVFLGLVHHADTWAHSLEEEEDIGVGRSSSIKQNSGIPIEYLLVGKASLKNATKSEFDVFTSVDKWTQLLLIKRFCKSQKFDKTSYYFCF